MSHDTPLISRRQRDRIGGQLGPYLRPGAQSGLDRVAPPVNDLRLRYAAQFYRDAAPAYRAMLYGNRANIALARPDVHQSSLRILKDLLVQYHDSATLPAARSNVLGLITEYTPIALGSLPSSTTPGVLLLSGREDDQWRSTDLYAVNPAWEQPFVPVQVKTSDLINERNIPENGSVIFASDFCDKQPPIATSEMLVDPLGTSLPDLMAIADTIWPLILNRRAKNDPSYSGRIQHNKPPRSLTQRIGDTAASAALQQFIENSHQA